MRFVVFVAEGCNRIAREEILKIAGKRLVKGKNQSYFTTRSALDGCKVCFLAQTIRRILLQVKEDELDKIICEDELRKKVVKKIENKFYVDFSGFDLDKRTAKDNPPQLSSSVAYLAAKEAGLKKTHKILDPLCRGSKLLIEAAALLNNMPAGKSGKFAFMKFGLFKDEDFHKLFKKWDKSKKAKLNLYGMDSYTGNVENAKENLKNADVEANISARSIDWMDCLFEEKTIDRIITMLPPGKHKSTDALYRELFYQSAYCLKKNGLMILLSERENLIIKYAQQTNFSLVDSIALNRIKIFKLKPIS